MLISLIHSWFFELLQTNAILKYIVACIRLDFILIQLIFIGKINTIVKIY